MGAPLREDDLGRSPMTPRMALEIPEKEKRELLRPRDSAVVVLDDGSSS